MNCYHTVLQDEALLHISGPDTLTFLQGQTTCDTREVDVTRAVPGAYCTPQGRTVCDFLLTRLGEEHYALRMRKDILEHSAAVLGKYIVFSKADLDSTNGDWCIAACWGDDAGGAITAVFGQAPEGQYSAHSGEGFVVVQLDEQGQQFECHVDRTRQADRLQSLADQCEAGEEGAWQALQVEAGIARLEPSTVEEFVPQMLNYDVTGHISFTKGCYTGQEVVARLHYRGTPKRRLYIAHWDDAPVGAGTPLYRAGASQGVGNVVNSLATNGGAIGLVTSTREGVAEGLHLGSEDGPLLAIQPVPYTLPELETETES